MKNNISKEILVVLLLAVIMTGIFVFPMAPHFFEGIPYTHKSADGMQVVRNFQGDHIQFLYHLALLEKAMTGKIPFFTEGYQFATPYKAKYMTPYFPPQGPMFSILSPLGYAGAYNILVVLSFLIAFLSTYFYLKRLSITGFFAFAGALVFVFFPYRIASLYGGHPAGMMVAYIPLFLLLLDHAFSVNSVLSSLGAGIVLVFFALSEPHYLYFLFLFIPVYILYVTSRENIGLNVIDAGVYSADIPSPFKTKTKEDFYPVSALLSLIVFIEYYTFRRENLNFIVFLINVLIAVLIYYFINYISCTLYRLFLNERSPERCKKDVSKRTLIFNLFYLYFIQEIFEVKNLAFILGALFVIIYFFSFIIFIKLCEWGKVFSIIKKQFQKVCKFSIKAVLFSWPLLLSMIFCVAFMMYVKRGALDSSAIEGGRKIVEVKLFSPQLSDILKPFNEHSSRYVYPGLISIILGFLSIVLWAISFFKRKIVEKQDISMLFFGSVFLGSYLLSFGPNITILPLFEICRKIIPFFDFIRSPIKIIIFSSLSLSFLVGMTFKWISSKKKVAVLLILLIFAEYMMLYRVGMSVMDDKNAVLQALKSKEKKGKVLYVPVWPGDSSWSSLYQYYSLMTDTYMVNGYQPVIPADYIKKVADPLFSLNLGRITEKELKILNELGVTDIVFHKEAFPRKISPFPQRFTLIGLKNSPYLKYNIYHDPLYLFELIKNPSDDEKDREITFPFGYLAEGETFKPLKGQSYRLKVDGMSSKGAMFLTGSEDSAVFLDKYFPDGKFNGFINLEIEEENEDLSLIFDIEPRKKNIVEQREKLFKNISRFKTADGDYKIPISFSQSEPGWIRFNVIKKGSGTVVFDYLYCKFSDRSDPKMEVFPSDGIFIGTLEDEEKDESALFVDASEYPKGPAMFAPNRLYKKGSYKADFYLKGDNLNNKDITAARIQVTDGYEINVFAEKKIFFKELDKDNWRKFTLPFEIKKDLVLNFHVRFEGHGKLWVKKVIIKPPFDSTQGKQDSSHKTQDSKKAVLNVE
ncbi:MAG: hypothetical protein KAI43_00515 [Candidatus Aureabacteria bacterium]|nr:hypothetical protein [Candidatus Auribacterota bacterium]